MNHQYGVIMRIVQKDPLDFVYRLALILSPLYSRRS